MKIALSKFTRDNFNKLKFTHPAVRPLFTEFYCRIAMEGIYIRVPDDGGKRTAEEQRALYNKVPRVTWVLCPMSWHCHGLALELWQNAKRCRRPSHRKTNAALLLSHHQRVRAKVAASRMTGHERQLAPKLHTALGINRGAVFRPASAKRRGRCGIDSVSLHFTPGNMPVDMAERSLRLFAREVLPKVVGP